MTLVPSVPDPFFAICRTGVALRCLGRGKAMRTSVVLMHFSARRKKRRCSNMRQVCNFKLPASSVSCAEIGHCPGVVATGLLVVSVFVGSVLFGGPTVPVSSRGFVVDSSRIASPHGALSGSLFAAAGANQSGMSLPSSETSQVGSVCGVPLSSLLAAAGANQTAG